MAAQNDTFAIQTAHDPQARAVGYVLALVEVIATFGAPNIVIVGREPMDILVGVILGKNIKLEILHFFLIVLKLGLNLIKIGLGDLRLV